MVIDLITFRVRRGREREFEDQQATLLRLMRRSGGFIAQVLMRSADDPTEYRAEVRWVSRDYRDRFNAHGDPEVRGAMERSAALFDAPPTYALLEIV